MLGEYYDAGYEFEPGIDGFEIGDESVHVFMLPDEPVTKGWLTPAPNICLYSRSVFVVALFDVVATLHNSCDINRNQSGQVLMR